MYTVYLVQCHADDSPVGERCALLNKTDPRPNGAVRVPITQEEVMQFHDLQNAKDFVDTYPLPPGDVEVVEHPKDDSCLYARKVESASVFVVAS